MATPKCIITGCDIVFEGQSQHGDLWELGDSYIFNACGEPELGRNPEAKHLIVEEGFHRNYFEHRNVYVVSKSEASLSSAAQLYLSRSPR